MEHGDCIKETKRILGQYNKMKVAVQNLTEEIEARTAALQGESVAIARYGDEPMGGTAELTATEAAAARRMRAAADIEEMQEHKQDMERTLRAVGYTEKWARDKGGRALRDVALMVFGVSEKPL